METPIPDRLASLAHPQRLALFRLLMRRYPDHVPAGELAQALEVKASTLSAYLSALMQAGLVTRHRAGTSLRYTIAMTEVQRTFDYLLLDCCRGRPELCSPAPHRATAGGRDMTDPQGDAQPDAMPGADPAPHAGTLRLTRPAEKSEAISSRKYRVLFLCTGNSARSIFAEAILRDLDPDRFEVSSAGTRPRSAPNPFALAVLRRKGHDIAGLRAKAISDVQGGDAPAFDFVFTVCNEAANEDCPAWPGQPVSAHWGMPDPVLVQGSDAERSLAFRQTYGALRNRIRAFAALPIASLDRISLQQALDGIAARCVTGPAATDLDEADDPETANPELDHPQTEAGAPS